MACQPVVFDRKSNAGPCLPAESINMDVVCYSSAVFSGVIVSKRAESWSLAGSDLGDAKYGVVGRAIGVFPNKVALVGAHQIKIVRSSDASIRFCCSNVV
jgi:hypothetical protein